MSGSLVLENADFRVSMGWHPVDRSLGWARWALLPSDCPFLQMPHSRRSRQAAGRSREVAGGTLLSPGLGGGGAGEEGGGSGLRSQLGCPLALRPGAPVLVKRQ